MFHRKLTGVGASDIRILDDFVSLLGFVKTNGRTNKSMSSSNKIGRLAHFAQKRQLPPPCLSRLPRTDKRVISRSHEDAEMQEN